jgi:hypothetical protein
MAWTRKNTAVAMAPSLVFFLLVWLFIRHSAISPGRSGTAAGLDVLVERIPNTEATAEFPFKKVPRPDAPGSVRSARFSLVTGGQDVNGARVEKLPRGYLPTEPDDPRRNFFFSDGSYGGRILVDLNEAIIVQQVNTYSWHTTPRAPQLYKLYAGIGTPDGPPDGSNDLLASGWKLLASVDTRPSVGEPAGQYGVSITARSGSIGVYRYLLFDCKRTEDVDRWGNTFFSEIDVVAK